MGGGRKRTLSSTTSKYHFNSNIKNIFIQHGGARVRLKNSLIKKNTIDVIKQQNGFFNHTQMEYKDGMIFMRAKKRSMYAFA